MMSLPMIPALLMVVAVAMGVVAIVSGHGRYMVYKILNHEHTRGDVPIPHLKKPHPPYRSRLHRCGKYIVNMLLKKMVSIVHRSFFKNI